MVDGGVLVAVGATGRRHHTRPDPVTASDAFHFGSNGKAVTAKGADPDTLVASAKAYLGALNKLMIKRLRGKPEALEVAGRRIHSTDAI